MTNYERKYKDIYNNLIHVMKNKQILYLRPYWSIARLQQRRHREYSRAKQGAATPRGGMTERDRTVRDRARIKTAGQTWSSSSTTYGRVRLFPTMRTLRTLSGSSSIGCRGSSCDAVLLFNTRVGTAKPTPLCTTALCCRC